MTDTLAARADWVKYKRLEMESPTMRLPRVRFTVRRLMVAVAVAGALLYAYRSVPSVREILNDDPYHAYRSFKRTWPAGPNPSITVDVFEGSITVMPGPDGVINANISTLAVTKWSQAAADDARAAIDLGLHQQGDSLRITARGTSRAGIRSMAHVELSVPRGVSLDLRTARGSIRVGRDYANNTRVSLPVSAASVRAINASEYMLGYAEGSIEVETLAPTRASGEPPVPTRLELDAPGRIEVVADLAVVEARAWHGSPPDQWPPGSYEKEDEGRISFDGTLAPGRHSLRAAHRITLKVPGASPLQINAEAVGGDITGNLLPGRVGPVKGTTRWAGAVGSGAEAAVQLRTDDGPIVLLSKP
jgi:hypothetical protein